MPFSEFMIAGSYQITFSPGNIPCILYNYTNLINFKYKYFSNIESECYKI